MNDFTGFFQGEFENDQDGEVVKIPMSFFTMDCVTFFGSEVTRKFPDVMLTLYVSDRALWRPQQRFHIPEDSELTEEEIDNYGLNIACQGRSI